MPTGRFAPSPTGPLHVGNLRTALLGWLFARSSGARFLLRVEDLDRGAARDDLAEAQLADLAALGIDWDGEVVRQSDRGALYAGALADLEARGLLYSCYCTRREVRAAASAPHDEPAPVGPGDGQVRSRGDHPVGPTRHYPGTCRGLTPADRAEREAAGRRPALRVRAGGAAVEVTDRLRGRFTAPVDDFVVRRADGVPAYQLAVVVDDADQDIGQVVRGDDLLASTPRQAWLAGALGLPAPGWVHVPLVLGPDGRRLAKRHGAVTLDDLGRRGVGPGDLVAAVAVSLGLADPGEPLSGPGDLLARFEPDRLPPEPWVLDAATFTPGERGRRSDRADRITGGPR